MSGILQAIASFKAAAGGGGISVVQEAYSVEDANDAAPSATPVAFGSNVTAGNRIIVSLYHSYVGCPPSISDSLGNTYTSRGAQPTIANSLEWWVFDAVSGSSGANTITVNYACGDLYSIAALEVSGTSAYDATAGQNSTSAGTTSPKTTGAITTSSNGALVIAHFKEVSIPIAFSQDGAFVIKKAWTTGLFQNTAFIWYLQPTAGPIAVTIGSDQPGGGGGGGIVAYIP